MNGNQSDWIGIDLGTSTTCGAIIRRNRLEIVNVQGKRFINSVVCFRESSIIVSPRINDRFITQYTTVYEAKRLIGRKYKDVQEEIKENKWSFEVVEGENGMAGIKVPKTPDDHDNFLILSPEYIASFIMKELKQAAEEYDGHKFTSCVIACPVKFDAWQRQATMNAGYLAGFENVELVAEPSAAAVSYALKYDPHPDQDHIYVVYDFGGGTFDVSVVRRSGNDFQVIRTSGNDHLGGKDIDVSIMQYIEQQLDTLGFSVNPKRQLSFKNNCKLAKEMLSTIPSTDIPLDFCKESTDEIIRFLQSTLNSCTNSIMNKTIQVTLDTLHSCSPPLEPSDVHYVFLMGGSTRLSCIMNCLLRIFTKEQIKQDPTELCDCAIAYGASLISTCHQIQQSSDSWLLYADNRIVPCTIRDTCPQSIRIAHGDLTTVVIPEQTPIGFTGSIRLYPSSNQFKYTMIRIVMGNQEDRKNDRFVAVLKIPTNQQVSTMSQSLLVRMKLLDLERMDVVVTSEYDCREFHSVVLLGLTQEAKNALTDKRAQGFSMNDTSKKIESLRNSIASISSQCREVLKPADSTLREVEQLNFDALNKSMTIDDLQDTERRLLDIKNQI